MTKLLLDFPWQLGDALDDAAVAFILRDFIDLVRRTGLEPVRFLEQDEQTTLWEAIEQHRHAGAGQFAALMLFLDECAGAPGGTCEARPADPQPSGLRASWKRALREELVHEQHWRNPQIIVARSRHEAWQGGEETALYCDKCGPQKATGPHRRVLAVLDAYDSHRFALSDRDPWDLRRLHPPAAGPRQHPCHLPKPPIRQPLPLDRLEDELAQATRHGCRRNGKYFYIPPKGWKPDADEHAWRTGRAFPLKWAAECDANGYLDVEGHVWCWDKQERHWDVQWGGKDNYVTVNQEGVVLKCPAHLRSKIVW